MCNLIFEEFPEVQWLAGVATAGIAWGQWLRISLNCLYLCSFQA
jgi:orotate phosphoribosyltransferase